MNEGCAHANWQSADRLARFAHCMQCGLECSVENIGEHVKSPASATVWRRPWAYVMAGTVFRQQEGSHEPATGRAVEDPV